MDFGTCEIQLCKRRIVLKENKSKITFVNNENRNIRKVIVDGCVEIEGRKCDFLLITEDGTEYYVELKGCNVEEAVSQIENTIKKISSSACLLKKHSYIISTRCPLLSPQIQKIKLKFKKMYMSSLHIKKMCQEISI